MHTKLLTLIAALAVGGATGAVAFTSVRDTGPAPEQAPVSVSVPAAPVASTVDPCADPASTDPACVVVVQVPAAATSSSSSDDDGTADQGRGDAAPVPVAPGVKLRGDGTVDDSSSGIDDDRSGHGDDDSDDRDDDSDDRDDDRDDDNADSDDDDGTPDQGSSDR